MVDGMASRERRARHPWRRPRGDPRVPQHPPGAGSLPSRPGCPSTAETSRRVPGLRREEVALLAGISTEYYTRLERGNATGVSDSVIDGIAHALQLDEAERTHLLDLLRTAGTSRPPRRRATVRRGSGRPSSA